MTTLLAGDMKLDVVLAPWIAGRTQPTGEYIPVINPATGESVEQLQLQIGDSATIADAVSAASDARMTWATLTGTERGRVLRSVGDALANNAAELAWLETLDTGKPLSQARSDVNLACRYFEYYGSLCEALEGSMVDLGTAGYATVSNEPLGVTGHIVPWNYPIQIMCRSIVPSLAAGNTVVVKPAEDACLSTLVAARIATEAGLPPGVFNVVPGLGAVAGQALAEHLDIEHVSFTGSVEVGRHVAAVAAKRGRPSVLELGGKGAHLVLPSADLDTAMPVILTTLLQNGGQTCSAGTRLVVHQSRYDEAIAALTGGMKRVRVGPGLDDPDLGPLISARQRERVEGYVSRAVIAGADVLAESELPDSAGFFSPARVFGNVDPAVELAQDEIFGPVLTVLPFDDVDEGLAIVNGTRYGLTSGVWGREFGATLDAARKINAGQVYVNGFVAGGGVQLPFGGYKDSGYGREKGAAALKAYTQSRTTIISIN